RSIVCPEALNTYDEPAGAIAIRNGGFAFARSTTLIGSPLCRETMLHTSTAALIDDRAPSLTARTRYSDAGLLRPDGLKPPPLSLRSFLNASTSAPTPSRTRPPGAGSRGPSDASYPPCLRCRRRAGSPQANNGRP